MTAPSNILSLLIVFPSLWFVCPFADAVLLWIARRPSLSFSVFAHEIEVAAFVGLQDRVVEQPGVAAPGPLGIAGGLERRMALLQLGLVDQEFDAALGHIKLDLVAVPHQRQRTADRGLRRDVQHDGAERRA